MNLKIPYLSLRDGRPRWEPGPKLRREGWHGRDLKDAAGRWLGLDDAVKAARDLNDEVAARRAEGAQEGGAEGAQEGRTAGEGTCRPRPMKPARTVEHLHKLWSATPEHRVLREATRRDYEHKAAIVIAELGDIPVTALRHKDMKNLWRKLYRERGHHMANGVLAVGRAMLSHAVEQDWIAQNPAFNLRLLTPAPRQVMWLPNELCALVETADRLGYPSIGDAIVVALHTGQRQGDVLAMPARIFEETRIRLSQLKTAARIDAPMTRELMERVRLTRARRAVVRLDGPLIVTDAGGAPYRSDHFRHCFAEVRDAAVNALPPGDERQAMAAKRFQDLRDTAVTRLALAECTLPEICSITGHSPETATTIMKHYLALQPKMADNAIAKLQTWLDREGIAV